MVRSECHFYHLNLMLYMGFDWSLEVDHSFTHSCLSLTNISIFFVYTHLSRVGVWIGYPYTLDIEILRLNQQSFENKIKSNHTNKHLAPFATILVIQRVAWPKRAHVSYFRSQRIAIANSHLRVVAVLARSQLHIPEQVQPQHRIHARGPHRQSAR